MVTDESENLVSEVRDDNVLRVTINRPSKRNALDQDMLGRLGQIFVSHSNDQRVKLAVLTAAGDKCFAAGGDLRELAAIRTQEGAAEMSRRNRKVLDTIRYFPVPVIAALNGDALGGGAEIAFACDLRVASLHARLGFVQGRLAVTTAWGGVFDLAAQVGPAQALSLLCRSDLVSAEEALRLGLVNSVASATQSLDEAVAIYCKPMLGKPRHVLASFKTVIRGMFRTATREELEALETRLLSEAWVDDAHWRAAESVLPGSGA